MRKIVIMGVLAIGSSLGAAPLCHHSEHPKSPCAGWASLQQLRTLIPERLWEQDFSMKFQCAGEEYDYFLRSTFSGENIRLLDRYQEFLASPFWDNPPMLDAQKEREDQLMSSETLCTKSRCDEKRKSIEGTKLGMIRSEGNKYFAGSELVSYIRTEKGTPIVLENLVEDLAWMNQNPFRRTNAVFVPGKDAGVTDIDLVTTDRWPYRVYTGADNTGTIATERNRLIFGFDFGKTIVQDSQIAYQFTCSPNWNHFYAHTLSARVPCPWRHVAIFFGGYSQVEPELSGDGQKEKGTSWQVDARYRIPIITNQSFLQEFIFGYDLKETKNLVKDHGLTTFDHVADINQFMLGYELGHRTGEQRVTLVAEIYGNPGGITSKNHTKDYTPFRAKAKAEYIYGKLVHAFARKLPYSWWFSYDISGQISSANLLPSEQLVLAGYEAVRGFEERIISVDNGAIFHLSLETPHISPTSWFSKRKYVQDDLYLLGFFDCGIGANHTKGGNTKSLASVGPSIRYQWGRYVTAHLDYGYQLWHKGFFNPSDSRYNFGLIVSY